MNSTRARNNQSIAGCSTTTQYQGKEINGFIYTWSIHYQVAVILMGKGQATISKKEQLSLSYYSISSKHLVREREERESGPTWRVTCRWLSREAYVSVVNGPSITNTQQSAPWSTAPVDSRILDSPTRQWIRRSRDEGAIILRIVQPQTILTIDQFHSSTILQCSKYCRGWNPATHQCRSHPNGIAPLTYSLEERRDGASIPRQLSRSLP